MATDLDSAGAAPVNDPFLDDSQPLPGEEQIAGQDGELSTEKTSPLLDETPRRRSARGIGALAPAVLLLPLALVSLVVYLLKPGSFDRVTPVAQTAPAEPTGIPSLSSAPPTGEALQTPSRLPLSFEQVDARLAEARTLTLRSEFERALDIYQQLARQVPQDVRPEIGWARALLLDGLPDQALPHARRAVALDPANVEAAVALARAYVGVGDKARGLNAAHGAVQLNSRAAEAHAVLAEAYLLNGLFRAAVEEADMALDQDRKSVEGHRIRGKLYDAMDNDAVAAIHELQLAADLQPELWLRHYELGLLLLKGEDYDAAIVALTNAWVLRRKPLTYGALGQAYYRLGQYDRAASYLEQSLSAGAVSADTHALLAAINAHLGRCRDATIYLQQALDLDPNNPLALQVRETCPGDDSTPPAAPTVPLPSQGQLPPSPPPTALGGRIAFPLWNTETNKYDTYVANPDGTDRRLVVEGMHQPAFSLDGQWLAVNGDRHEHQNLFLVRADGSGLWEITEHVEDGLPCWSPVPPPDGSGGQSLVFSSTRHGDKQSRVFVMDRVPFDGEKAQARPLNAGVDDARGEYPAWMSDGRIAYAGCHYDGASAQCGLLAMSAEPGPQIPEALTLHPGDTAPAAFGTTIAFMSDRDGNWEIYVVNGDGSGLKRLTHNTSNEGLPTWSPDGRTIALVSDQGGAWAVWAINLDGSGSRKLFDLGGGGLASEWQHQRISWGP
jgi:tetratricopeptide (TPR) repeat protein